MSSVKDAISAATNKFTSYTQEDAHEFLGTCLDQVEKEFKFLSTESQKSSEPKEEKNETTKRKRDLNMNPFLLKDPSSRTFAAEVEVSLQCCSCAKMTKKSEYYLDFSMDISEGRKSTQTLFNRFFEVCSSPFLVF